MKKYILLTSMLFIITALSQAQNLNGFFDKYADDERFSYTKIGKNMQTLTLEINSETKALASSVEKEVLEIMKKDNFELEVASREKGESSFIYSKPNPNAILSESVIINRDKNEINILWTIGKNKKKAFNANGIGGMEDLGMLPGLSSLESLSSLQSLDGLKSLEGLKDLESLKNLGTLKDFQLSAGNSSLPKDSTNKASK